MLSKIIYELTKVFVYELDENNSNVISCHSMRSGYFSSVVDIVEFIKKHNHDLRCFFIARSYVFNPVHAGQAHDCVTERTYDNEGNLLCDCPTHRFIVNYNEMNAANATNFTGRKNYICNKDDIAWYYDKHEDLLRKCKVAEVPYDIKEAKKYKDLEWYDDSYLVYPFPLTKEDNHQHIISCYIFDEKFIEKMLS